MKDNLDRSIGLFQSAIRKDPRFARAHAGLGEAYWRKYQKSRIRSGRRWRAIPPWRRCVGIPAMRGSVTLSRSFSRRRASVTKRSKS